ncbi:hypothetical protein K3495_g3259 [Podosphaera aphanis]|nr:hypothetical protein K3495_g3259 [Podosphaera aphanis]
MKEEAPALRYGEEYYDIDFDITPQEYEDTVLEDDKNVDLSVLESNHSPVEKDSLSSDVGISYNREDSTTALSEEKSTKPDYISSTTIIDPFSNETRSSSVETKRSEINQSPAKCVGSDLPESKEHIIISESIHTDQSDPNTPNDLDHSESSSNNCQIDAPAVLTPEHDTVTAVSPDPPSSTPKLSQIANGETQAKTTLETVCELINYDREYLPTSETTDDKIESCNLVICYQSSEYALFPSTELDDPNTFFITDRSVIHKPLSELFKEIREIVNEDLGDDGELFIVVPDFDLQVEEASSSLEMITLSQIISLHSHLQLNDGVDVPQPMYIELGIRKNFIKGLLKFTSAAKCGKGLSAIASWDDNSEGIISFQEEHDIVLSGENNVQDQETFSCTRLDADSDKEHETQLDQVEDNSEENEQEFYIDVSRSIKEDENTSSRHASLEATSVQSRRLSETRIMKSETSTKINFDEDGDIIDYSENEFEFFTSTKYTTAIVDKNESNMGDTPKGVHINTDSLCNEDNSYPVDDLCASAKSSHSHTRTNVRECNSMQESFRTTPDRKSGDIKELVTKGSEYQDLNEESQENFDNESISGQVFNENPSQNLDNTSINGEYQITSHTSGRNIGEAQGNELEYDDEGDNYEYIIKERRNKRTSIMDEEENDLNKKKVTTTFEITDKSASCDSRSSKRISADVLTEDVFLNNSTQDQAQNLALKSLEAKFKVEVDEEADVEAFAGHAGESLYVAEDPDEIGYDEEEDEEVLPLLGSSCCPDVLRPSTEIMSPISGKRSRAESDLNDPVDDNISKRHRPSGNPPQYLESL